MNKKNRIAIIALSLVIIVSVILLNKAKTYEVYVNYVGGGNNYTIKVHKGEKIEQPQVPQLEGFTFLYWSSHGHEYDFNTPITNDIDLVATYQRAYKIRFISNGQTIEEYMAAEGSLIDEITNLEDENYVFVGWYYQDSLFDFTAPIKKDVDLIAKWDNPIHYLKASQPTIKIELNQVMDIVMYFDYQPSNAVFNATFTSSAEDIVRVDDKGSISAIELGEAVISMSVGELSADILVEVIGPSIETITLPTTLYCDQGGSIELKSMIIPENADKSALSYTIEDGEIASIDKNGLISGLKAGVTTVTVSAGNVSSQSTLYVNGVYLDCRIVDAVRTYHLPSKSTINYTLKLVEYYNGKCTETDLRDDDRLLLNDGSNDGCLQIDEDNNITLRYNSSRNVKDSFFFTYGNYNSNTVYFSREPEVAFEALKNIEPSSFTFSYLVCKVQPLNLQNKVVVKCNCQLMNVVPAADWISEWSMSENVLTFSIDTLNFRPNETAFELKTVAAQEFEIVVISPEP